MGITMEQVRKAATADVNLVVSESGLKPAQLLREKYVKTEVQIENIIQIAKAARAYARERLHANHEIGIKSAQDVVTEVDRRNEAYILSELRTAYPEDAILTEEK